MGNMFLYFENFAEKNMAIHVIRMFIDGDLLKFEEQMITTS
jgi:hypothetical protein